MESVQFRPDARRQGIVLVSVLHGLTACAVTGEPNPAQCEASGGEGSHQNPSEGREPAVRRGEDHSHENAEGERNTEVSTDDFPHRLLVLLVTMQSQTQGVTLVPREGEYDVNQPPVPEATEGDELQ